MLNRITEALQKTVLGVPNVPVVVHRPNISITILSPNRQTEVRKEDVQKEITMIEEMKALNALEPDPQAVQEVIEVHRRLDDPNEDIILSNGNGYLPLNDIVNLD